jgi:hypothetical protein
MQQPFQAGDLLEVEGYMGFVQQVTTRDIVLSANVNTYYSAIAYENQAPQPVACAPL